MKFVYIMDVTRANDLDEIVVVDAETRDEAWQKLYDYAPQNAEDWEDLKVGSDEVGLYGTLYQTDEIMEII